MDPRSVCDGLLTSVGERNFPLVARFVTAVWTVPAAAVAAEAVSTALAGQTIVKQIHVPDRIVNFVVKPA